MRRNPQVIEAYLGGAAVGVAGEAAVAEHTLVLEGLTAGYDQAAVIRGLDLTVDAGEVVALLGPNGAGKTTTLRTISGLVKPLDGRVLLDGADLARLSPSSRAEAGHRARARGPRPLLRSDRRRALPRRPAARAARRGDARTSTSRC